ncbi:uncharacterized protein [Blastocystis hominis]|uniref:Amidohydrolase-related domain-containing protein n=1 Tax=Blastocystis hominis TaxID=12968 RepID=D8M4I3_BLAHO|nr:uncharacterized protein [Blastocystis hominis]CBK22972.2 unnamed protein product [Blastocystis hominis]|eukprot:XP_012897020.1 uncharacterized protein [Blastocystis hominis]
MLGKQVVDLVLSPKWIIPIVPRGSILKNTSIVVNNGVIVDIADRQIVSEKYEAKTEYKLGYHVVLPGFVNAHTHTPMFLFKSYGDDNSLSDWLQHFIWPMEDMFISPRFIRDGLQMGCAEMIRSGTTCFNDMYYYPEESAEEVEKIGMRAIIGLMGRDNEGSLKTVLSAMD